MLGVMLGYFLLSLLLVVLAIPLIQRRIKPNWIYGFRTPKTINNPDIWYPVNEYAGKWMLGVGIFSAITSVIFYFVTSEPGTYVGVVGTVIGIGCLVMVIAAVLHLRKYP